MLALTFDNTVLRSATLVSSGMGAGGNPMPAHCLVRGEFSPRSGVHGVHDGINFELRQPLAWNGRFQLQGGGCLGMMASQRLSQHFDGIVSGAPIQEQHAAQVGSLYGIQAFAAIAPADAGGSPSSAVSIRTVTARRLSRACCRPAMRSTARPMADPRNSRDEQLYPGIPWDTGIGGATWWTPISGDLNASESYRCVDGGH